MYFLNELVCLFRCVFFPPSRMAFRRSRSMNDISYPLEFREILDTCLHHTKPIQNYTFHIHMNSTPSRSLETVSTPPGDVGAAINGLVDTIIQLLPPNQTNTGLNYEVIVRNEMLD